MQDSQVECGASNSAAGQRDAEEVSFAGRSPRAMLVFGKPTFLDLLEFRGLNVVETKGLELVFARVALGNLVVIIGHNAAAGAVP